MHGANHVENLLVPSSAQLRKAGGIAEQVLRGNYQEGQSFRWVVIGGKAAQQRRTSRRFATSKRYRIPSGLGLRRCSAAFFEACYCP